MSSALVQLDTTCITRLRRQTCSYINSLACHLHSFNHLLHLLHVHILTHWYVICTRSTRYNMYYTIMETDVFIYLLTRMSSALVQPATIYTTCSYINSLVCHLHSFSSIQHVLHDYGDGHVHILTHSHVICTHSTRYYIYYMFIY